MKNCSTSRMFHSRLFCCSKNDNQCQSKSESPMLLHWSSTPGKEEIHADYNLQVGNPYTYMPTARVLKTNVIFFSMFHSCLFCCPKNDNQCRKSKLNLPCSFCMGHPLQAKQFCNSYKLQISQIHAIYTPGKADLQFVQPAILANLQSGNPYTNQQEFKRNEYF